MKKNIIIIVSIVLFVFVLSFISNYIDSGRVTTGHEPIFCIKFVSSDGGKITYLGLGYKVIRYVGVSPKEDFSNSMGVKMGSWFMKYDFLEEKKIKIEKENNVYEVIDQQDKDRLLSILENSRYDREICNGFISYKIFVDNEVYVLKESCKEIQKGDKQTLLSDEDLESVLTIINKYENE